MSSQDSLENVPHEKTELENIDELYSKCNGIDMREITISKLHELFSSKQINSVDVAKFYMDRIKKLDPILKCVVEINLDALSEATRADLERSEGKYRSEMHGIPVLIKENIATDDRMLTTAGSLALVNCRPKEDAEVVKLLRKAGAVILGKANTSEFAFWRGTNVPDGWSSRCGQTKNAYNLCETPEGSSSGPAVSVSANLVMVSVGTETDGSLLAPACRAGICTIKPTLGLIPTKGVIPISHNQDTVGPMARSIPDLAILLDAMVPQEKKRRQGEGSYANCTITQKHEGKFRLGVVRHPYWDVSVITSENLKHQLPHLENILYDLKGSSRFEILDPVTPKPELVTGISVSKETTVLRYDFKHDINEYLKHDVIPSPNPREPRVTCLKDVIEFNVKHPSPEGYNQELLIQSEATRGLDEPDYIEARDSNRAAARDLLDSVIAGNHLDALVFPTFPSDPRMENGDCALQDKFSDTPLFGWSVAAIAGYPSLQLPAGIGLKGVPYGLTFVALPFQETTLLQLAHEIERMNGKRRKPRFLSS